MMHAVKASWGVQTFALAKSNESGGKKSRIRRSKEERKTMVESFIKRHQKLNNGNFPSLSLTHREVGGSFYTVREIVREIIQENKVLGPAKLSPKEADADPQQEQDLSGSVLTEHVILLSISLNGIDSGCFMHNQLEVPEEEPMLSPENGGSVCKSLEDVENEAFRRNLKEPFTENREFGSDKLNIDEQNVVKPERNSSGTFSMKSGVSLPVPSNRMHLVPDHDHVHNSFSPERGNRKLGNTESESVKETVCLEGKAAESFEVEKTVKEVTAANSEATNITEGSTSTTDVPMGAVAETIPRRPVTPMSNFNNGRLVELENASQNLKQNEIERADVVVSNGSVKPVDPAEIAPPSSGLQEKSDGETKDLLSNKAFRTADRAASNDTKIKEPKTGTLRSRTIEPNQPAANREDATAKGNRAKSNRTRTESSDRACNDGVGTETNPFSAILKSFFTAFLRFWSE